MSKLDFRNLDEAGAANAEAPATVLPPASSPPPVVVPTPADAPRSHVIPVSAGRADGEADDHVGADRVRQIVLSGVVGFVLAFALVSVGMYFATPYGTAAAVGAGAFVGAFGGFGIGAMLGGSLSH